MFAKRFVMIDKYSNLSNYKILKHWIVSNKKLLNQKDSENNSILDWILHGYRGKNNYKLELIELIVEDVDLTMEQINKIFYMILMEKENGNNKKIYNALLKNTLINHDSYKKEMALTSACVLKSGELEENKLKIIAELQPDFKFLLEQININLISEAGLLNCLLLLSELQEIYNIVYENCGIDGKEIMNKINLFLLTDIDDKTINISNKIVKKNAFLKLNHKLKSKPKMDCLDKVEKINKI